MIEIRAFTGSQITPLLDDLARLRIAVFRDWPYLYDGTESYERAYLSVYATAPGAIVVAAFEDGQLVGAATGCPLVAHSDDFGVAFKGCDIAQSDVFYCAESVLLPPYRGQGVGHAFFDHREQQARALGLKVSAFCAVVRPEDHPDRPTEYRPLDPFWRKRGYQPMPGVLASFDWQDIGDDAESAHRLQFWSKSLVAA